VTTRRPPDPVAVAGVTLATAFWGCSFTWAKAGGAGVNDALGLPGGSPVGPTLFLALRFLLSAVVWAVVVPRSLRGWTRRGVGDGLLLGGVLLVPMVFQVIGLDRTSEAVSAFLTSLTVVVVPVVLTLILRRPPRPGMWGAVALALLGIWLMTGAAPTGFGVGELLGLLCGILFSGHILALDRVMRRESTPRMALAQFAVGGVGALLVCPFLPGGWGALAPDGLAAVLTHGLGTGPTDGTRGWWASDAVLANLVPVTVVSTLAAFALIFSFQPRLSPTRAAIVYLFEPIFASLFAWVVVGRTLAPIALAGGALILVANGLAEVVSRRDDGVDSSGPNAPSTAEE